MPVLSTIDENLSKNYPKNLCNLSSTDYLIVPIILIKLFYDSIRRNNSKYICFYALTFNNERMLSMKPFVGHAGRWYVHNPITFY